MRGSYIASKLIQVFINFNSRLYMRGSSLPQMEVPTLKYFNSRLYMRGSADSESFVAIMHISIHAST